MAKHENWIFPLELSKQEERICNRLKQNGKLFVFLRKSRHLIFTDDINQKLLSIRHSAVNSRIKPPICFSKHIEYDFVSIQNVRNCF